MLKNPQFCSNWSDIQAILPTLGLVKLTNDRAKIMNFIEKT